MSIVWRPAANWSDIEQGLTIQPKHLGDAQAGKAAAMNAWRVLFHDPLCAKVAAESSAAIEGHRIVGFGATVLVSTEFADAEIANPRPDINSRVIASIHSGRPVVATRKEVARANARDGVDVVVLIGNWRDQILTASQRHELQAGTRSSFAEHHAGYRFRRIILESADKPRRQFLQSSVVIETLAEFPESGRVVHMMTRESARAESSSVANLSFGFREPVLRLRDSDQRLLLAALPGATDQELTTALGLTLSAVKARWRSNFARIAETMPELLHDDITGNDARGTQKRHRVLAYVRRHPEELRPYHWKTQPGPQLREGRWR